MSVADVCVIGSGICGQAVAATLASAGAVVQVLEAGREQRDSIAQDIARSGGASSGTPFVEPGHIRTIALGGNARRWKIDLPGRACGGIRLAPMARADFLPRRGGSRPAWPISWSDLASAYASARKFCGIEQITGIGRHSGLPDGAISFPAERIRTEIFQIAPSDRFWARRCAAYLSPPIRVDEGAYALELVPDRTGESVDHVLVGDLKSRECRRVHAGAFVLALGALENPHLLLRSRQRRSEGIGNASGNVGRYLMDHPMVSVGTFAPRERGWFDDRRVYDALPTDFGADWGHLVVDDDLVAGEDLLGSFTAMFPYSAGESRPPRLRTARGNRTSAVASAASMLTAVRSGRLPRQLGSNLREILSGPDDLCALMLDRIRRRGRNWRGGFDTPGWSLSQTLGRFDRAKLLQLVEQSPDPDNRVLLSDRVNLLGVPRMRLDWRWSAEDQKRLARIHAIFRDAFSQSGEIAADAEDGGPLIFRWSSHHPSGTTRMSIDPRDGVVDPSGRMHEVRNAWIVGSSVFPLSGYAPPTLTAVALALMAAESLVHQF